VLAEFSSIIYDLPIGSSSFSFKGPSPMKTTPVYSWHDLALMPEDELNDVDPAVKNLACAKGLPSTEKLDIEFCLQQIDSLTERVWRFTAATIYDFRRRPSEYENSEAYFRALVMITHLQRDCGIKYNPAKIPHTVPFYPEDTFINGIFQGDGGTCASLPVLYTSIGKRLGYPIKLVRAPGHIFCRWDAPDARFNMEATAPGLTTPPDQHYREGMYKDHWEMEKFGGGLKSLTSRRELACFINARVEYWWKSKHYRNAVNCCAWCAELDGHPLFLGKLEFYIQEWERILLERQPSILDVPVVQILRRRFNSIPSHVEDKLLAVGVRDDVLRDFHLNGRRDYPGWTLPGTNENLPLFLPFHGVLPWRFADEYTAW
jgi:hypothetical protein